MIGSDLYSESDYEDHFEENTNNLEIDKMAKRNDTHNLHNLCHQCNTNYPNQKCLLEHFKLFPEHKGNHYMCEDCGKTYTSKSHLKRHIMRAHPSKPISWFRENQSKKTAQRKSRKVGKHSAENMLKAIKLHRKGFSIRQAAKECNVTYPTLRRYINKNINIATDKLQNNRLTPHYEVRMIFTMEQEKELKCYILDFNGLTAKECRGVAYQMAKMNDISVPNNWEKEQLAGKDWFRQFKKRHPDINYLPYFENKNKEQIRSP